MYSTTWSSFKLSKKFSTTSCAFARSAGDSTLTVVGAEVGIAAVLAGSNSGTTYGVVVDE